jgi:anti-sigma B factor antagonist
VRRWDLFPRYFVALAHPETAMPSTADRHWLECEDIGGVTVVRFLVRSAREEPVIAALFGQLDRLVEQGGCRQLVLNFGNVDAVASYAVGRLISLSKKVGRAQGRLALCCLTPALAEIMAIMQLWRMFPTYPTEQDALQSFAPR